MKRYDVYMDSSETYQGMIEDEDGCYIESLEFDKLREQLMELHISNMQSAKAASEYGDEANSLIYKGRSDAFEEAFDMLSGKKGRKRN